MDLRKLNKGQRKELYESIKIQKLQARELTPSEEKALNRLHKEFATIIKSYDGMEAELSICGNKAKWINIDDFGDGYRPRYQKIKETHKGFFITGPYSNARIYLNI